MGIFSKKDDDHLVLLMPDGSLPEFGGQNGFNNFIEGLTITPEKYDDKKGIAQSDMKAYIDATASLLALGIDDGSSEKIYAFGPIVISGLPGYRGEMQGHGVVTENFLIVKFAYGLGINYFAAPYDEVEGVQSLGSLAAEFTFRNSIFFDKKGKNYLQSQNIILICKTGKDGHENRRAFSMWHTNAHMVKRQFKN